MRTMKYKKKQRRLRTEKMTENQILIYTGGGGGGRVASPGSRMLN